MSTDEHGSIRSTLVGDEDQADTLAGLVLERMDQMLLAGEITGPDQEAELLLRSARMLVDMALQIQGQIDG